ncbi:hypothetical protein CQA53_02695 [Helicobacter didelphidarum]|uniref:OmpA-like domain-containing protein n=2 Tax=Helicobacter didelphidarum TaxID=2040648 RepID=A0A3D8INJ1_9HELI|nr:hypothetical protein CQA53_02695 [Helicobacter didelphidarum]
MQNSHFAFNDLIGNSNNSNGGNYGPEGAFMPLDYGNYGDIEINHRLNNDSNNNGKDNTLSHTDNQTIEQNNNGNSLSDDPYITTQKNFNTDSNHMSNQNDFSNLTVGNRHNNGTDTLALDSLSAIYFDFDKYNIRENMKPYIQANAEYIRQNNIQAIVLQGNTDEFGSDEYNMALGQKRAISVREALILQGLPRNMFSTISYGTHNPVCYEKTQECYAQNRRTEIVEKK